MRLLPYPEDMEDARRIFNKELQDRTGLTREELDSMSLSEFHERFIGGEPVIVDPDDIESGTKPTYPDYSLINWYEVFEDD